MTAIKLNWDDMSNEFGSNFKPYADEGIHEATLKDVTMKTTGSGTIFFEFNFEEDDNYQYPKVSRALFRDEKQKFRAYHYKNIMTLLGASEDNARKAVEVCEGKANRDAVADSYVQAFNRLAQKHPKIKLEVTSEVNGDKTYARGEFADPSVHFSNKKAAPKKSDDILPSDDDIDMDSIPF